MAQDQRLSPFFESDELISKFKKMRLQLNDECTIMFKEKLNLV